MKKYVPYQARQEASKSDKAELKTRSIKIEYIPLIPTYASLQFFLLIKN